MNKKATSNSIIRGIVRGIVAVEIFMLGVLPTGGWGLKQAYADSPGSATCPALGSQAEFGGSNCESYCQASAPTPTPSPSASGSGTSSSQMNDVFGANCAVICQANLAIVLDITAAAVYTTAGAICLAAAAAAAGVSWIPGGQGAAAAYGQACMAAGLVATGMDISADLTITAEGHAAIQEWAQALNWVSTAVVAGAEGVAGAALMSGSTGKLGQLRQLLSDGGDLTAPGLATIAGILLAIAGVKYGMAFGEFKQTRNNACSNINNLFSSSSGGSVGGGSLQNNNPAISAGPVSQASAATSPFSSPNSPQMKQAQNALAQGLQNAATAGGITPDSPAGQNLQNLGNQLASQLPQTAQGLAGGQSPASAAGGMMPQGTPGSVTQALKNLDEASKKHPLVELSSNSLYSGGGHPSKNGSSGGGDLFNFGNLFNKGKSDDGAGKSQEIAFGSQNKMAKPTLGTDIWHQGFQGTVFDIISIRLKQDRDQVNQMEWATPLNRALMGLPKLAPGAPVKEIAPQK